MLKRRFLIILIFISITILSGCAVTNQSVCFITEPNDHTPILISGLHDTTPEPVQSGDLTVTVAETETDGPVTSGILTTPAPQTSSAPVATTKATIAPTAVKTVAPTVTPSGYDYINNLPLETDVKQVILVKNKKAVDVKTEIVCYEKDSNNVWKQVQSCSGYVGKDGMEIKTREGTKITPMGSYGFVFMFGKNADPGVHPGWNYRPVGKGDYWAANFDNIDEYNVWIHFDGTRAEFAKRYGSLYESLNDISVYTYCAVLDYNYGADKVIGKGSAIFLHESANKATGGCIATDQKNLVKMLKWLDPAKSPRIVLGTEAYLKEVCESGKF